MDPESGGADVSFLYLRDSRVDLVKEVDEEVGEIRLGNVALHLARAFDHHGKIGIFDGVLSQKCHLIFQKEAPKN